MEVDMIFDVYSILDKIFPNSADWYALNDELGNNAANRILKDADCVMWDEDPRIAVTVAYGTYAIAIKIIETDWKMARTMRYVGTEIARELLFAGCKDNVQVFQQDGKDNVLIIGAYNGIRFK